MGSWNFPILTSFSPLIYAISAGNTAVLKPSELAPNSLIAMKALCESYLDKDAYICIEGQIEVAKALPTKKFDGLCFTGSTEKGKLVAASAAQNLIPCVFELGGKSPIVVDIDADLEMAANKISFGRFLNAG
jgi:aldehyde dehydrogenase (NAD+)